MVVLMILSRSNFLMNLKLISPILVTFLKSSFFGQPWLDFPLLIFGQPLLDFPLWFIGGNLCWISL